LGLPGEPCPPLLPPTPNWALSVAHGPLATRRGLKRGPDGPRHAVPEQSAARDETQVGCVRGMLLITNDLTLPGRVSKHKETWDECRLAVPPSSIPPKELDVGFWCVRCQGASAHHPAQFTVSET